MKMPFVIGGDWNMAPTALAGTGFPQRLRAFIAAPGEATYTSGGSQTEIDFFVVS